MPRVLNPVLALLVIVATSSVLSAAPRHPAAAPDFTFLTSSGSVSLHDFRGKVVYIDFWASWCVPCRESFPWMASMSDKYAGKGLVVVAINLDKNREAADAFLENYPKSFTVAFDPSGETAERFRVQAMPSSFIVDRHGSIVWTHEGFEASRAKEVEERIKEELSR